MFCEFHKGAWFAAFPKFRPQSTFGIVHRIMSCVFSEHGVRNIVLVGSLQICCSAPWACLDVWLSLWVLGGPLQENLFWANTKWANIFPLLPSSKNGVSSEVKAEPFFFFFKPMMFRYNPQVSETWGIIIVKIWWEINYQEGWKLKILCSRLGTVKNAVPLSWN